MPKCSRFISNSPASDHDEAPPFSSVPTPSAPQNEDPEKQQSIKDHIFAQTVVEPPDRTGSEHMISIPRSYQLELAELAKSGNVLVCLDTGSGKTLISVLLLQHMHQQSIAPPSSPALPLRAAPRQPHRVSFFLVNLVPLVHQQSSVIASNSNLAVGKLYGELKDAISSKGSKFPVDSWRAPQWKALLESHQVIVSTAQCFLDALIHGFVKMADLNLLIFDEVHHALKNHPFSRIMTYYRLAPEHQRPKIFGMTASPIFTSTGCFDEASRYLQKTMNARIHTVSRETLHALHEVKQKPEELVIEYEPYLTVLDDESNGAQMSALSKEMIAKFGRCPALDDGRNVAKDAALDLVTGYFEKEVRPKLEYTMRQLGPVGCDLLWHSTLLEYRSHARKWVNIDPENPTLISNDWILNASMRKLAVSPDPPSNGPKSSGSPDHDASAPSTAQFSASGFGLGLAVAHLSTHSELNQGILLRMREQPALPDVLRFDESNSSPKLLRLIETLRCFEPSAAEFCGIIFVERRQTATLLVELIKRAPGLEFLHPEVLLGHENSAANGGAPGMDWHDQVQALNRFRRREPTNLLVATSIAEEGLDIQAANLVIRFDLFNRHISFLQSRGRARADGSRYILMAEARNRDHVQTILNAFNIETNRTDWLQGVAGPAHDAAFWQDEWQQKLRIEVDDDAGSKQNLHEPSTGARLYPEDAPTLISHYAATLHSEYLKDAVLAYRINVDGDARCPTAHHCVLELPSTSAVRSVASGACSSKKQAKRMAAFLACKQLRELGELDEWLMPKNVGKTAAAGPTRADTDQINPHHKAWGESGKPVSVPVKRMDGWARFCASSAAEVGTDEYHATFLPLDSFDSSCQPLLLLSRARLPPTKLLQLLHPISGRLKDLCPASLGTFSTLSTEQVDAATRFTKFVFKLISRKDGKSADGQESYSQLRHDDSGEPAVLVVPVRLASGVTEVHSAADLEFDLPASLDLANFDISAASTGELNGRVLVRHHRCDSPSLYRFEAVRRDLEPNTPITSATPNSDAPMVATYFSQHLQRHDQRHAPHVEGADDEIAAKLECELAGTPLVETTKLATVQNLLSPSENPAQRRTNASATRVLVPFSYKVHPLCAALVASILLLPSVLTRYDQVLLAHACNVDLFNGELDTDSVLEALTSPSARAGFNYERLEFLGDTFLKLVATCHTFTTCLQRTKAELHLANKELLTNARLLTEAKRLGLHRYGVFQSGHFVARRFSAPVVGAIGGELVHNSLPEAEEGEGRAVHEEESRPGAAAAAAKVDLIKGKTLSDMVEALIGAALATGGVDKALMVCRKLRLIPATIRSLSDFNTQLHKLKAQSVAEGWEARVSTAGLQQLEELFAHTYRYPHLGLEAFTHPSLLASMLPSYQRLEFLGDAWLDFHIVTKIFAEHPELSPGEMTALKASLVSNAALSALGHRLGLHKYVASNSAVLSSTIKQYAAALDAILQRRAEASTDASEEGEQYWTQLHPDVVMPKAVSDVVEASFASIVVDCAFDVRVSQRVFTRIYAPFYDAFCRWDSVRIRDAKRMIEYLFDALRRGATTTSTASSICIAPAMVEVAVETNVAEVGGALQDHDDKDGRGGGEERVVRAMLTPIEARLRVGATVVGHYTGLPRSVVHLVRAVDVVNEIKVVQARIRDHRALCARNLVATNSINISDDENDPEDDEGSEDAEGADGAGDTGEAGAQWVERLVALLDEYEHLMRELVRALGWKYIFQSQPATLITSDETEQGNSEATERERLRPYSLGELRALVVGDTA